MSKDRRIVNEGSMKKGGQKPSAPTPRPTEGPKGQSGSGNKDSKTNNKSI